MKKDKIIYWATTGIIATMMLMSAVMYLTSPEAKEGFAKIAFPDFFRVELGISKGLAAIALLLPMVPRTFKGFAYAGLVVVFVSAAITHFAIDDAKGAIMPLVMLGVLGTSYWAFNRIYPGVGTAAWERVLNKDTETTEALRTTNNFN